MRDERIEMKAAATVKINANLLAQLEALPNSTDAHRKVLWTPEKDAALLKFWPVKKQVEVAKILGISVGTCRTRYRELAEERS